MRHRRTALQRLCLLLGLAIGIPAFGQGMELSFTDESALPGDPVTVTAEITNDAPIQAFSFALRHDGAVLTPTAAVPGAACAALNGGAGPDYFLTDFMPVNGPGIVVAMVSTFAAPDEIPIGVDHEGVLITYDVSAAAAPASITDLEVASDIGDPVVLTVFTVDGNTVVPATVDGSVAIEVPAPTGVTAAVLDQCACSFDVSWSNGAAYDSVEVRLDGLLVGSFGGGTTSTTVSLAGPGSGDVCVRGIVGGVESADSCATATCDPIVPAPPPSGLTCAIATSDPVNGCTVDVSWTLGGTYTDIMVTLDGVPVETLAGTATTTTLSLVVDANSQQICLFATDECGTPLSTSVCCDVTCLPGTLFVRGDCNVDGGIDIGDVIQGLNILFSGAGPASCADACDNNDDGQFDISDGVYLLATLFSGGPPPPAPNPSCGIDLTDDALECDNYPGC